jgi:hypothetical protein
VWRHVRERTEKGNDMTNDNRFIEEYRALNAARIERALERAERDEREGREPYACVTSSLVIAGYLVAGGVAWACVAYLLAIVIGVV